jgi:hypothetical protein
VKQPGTGQSARSPGSGKPRDHHPQVRGHDHRIAKQGLREHLTEGPHVITEPDDERLAAAVQGHVTPAVDDLERLMQLLTGLTRQLTAGLAVPKLEQ